MARQQLIQVRARKNGGEWTVQIPPGWELRLRRVVANMVGDVLPKLNEKGLTPSQREARRRLRRQRMQRELCRYLAEVITADIIGKEIALGTRGYYGTRKGTLREHVEAILRETPAPGGTQVASQPPR